MYIPQLGYWILNDDSVPHLRFLRPSCYGHFLRFCRAKSFTHALPMNTDLAPAYMIYDHGYKPKNLQPRTIQITIYIYIICNVCVYKYVCVVYMYIGI